MQARAGKICEECFGEVIHIKHEGTIVCTSCGLVQASRVIADEQEWRNFGDDGPAPRCGGMGFDPSDDRGGLSVSTFVP